MVYRKAVNPAKELADLKFQGQKLVKNPREVLRVLRQFLDLMRSDQFKKASYPSNLDKNSAAVVNAMLKEITDLYNRGKIKGLDVPKDAATFKLLTAAIKTDVSVKGSLKRERRIIAVAAAPVKWKKPIERDFVYDVTIRDPRRSEAFTFRLGADTKLETTRTFGFDRMKKSVARLDTKKLSVTRGNTYVPPSEFKQLIKDGKIIRVKVVKQKTS